MNTSIHANKDILGEGVPPSFERAHALLFKNLQLISRLRKPVLNCGSPKEQDARDVYSHYTFYDSFDKEYYTYYNNTQVERGRTFFHRFSCRITEVGYATSKDGIIWKKYENNPILTGSRSGWDELIYDFTPFYDAESKEFIALFYGGIKQCVGISFSKDGVDWHKCESPVILPDERTWEFRSIISKWLGKVNGTHVLAYEAGKTGYYAIGLTYSNDLMSWKREPQNPILTVRPNCFDSKFVADPSLVIRGDELRICYGARDFNRMSNVGSTIFQLGQE